MWYKLSNCLLHLDTAVIWVVRHYLAYRQQCQTFLRSIDLDFTEFLFLDGVSSFNILYYFSSNVRLKLFVTKQGHMQSVVVCLHIPVPAAVSQWVTWCTHAGVRSVDRTFSRLSPAWLSNHVVCPCTKALLTRNRQWDNLDSRSVPGPHIATRNKFTNLWGKEILSMEIRFKFLEFQQHPRTLWKFPLKSQ